MHISPTIMTSMITLLICLTSLEIIVGQVVLESQHTDTRDLKHALHKIQSRYDDIKHNQQSFITLAKSFLTEEIDSLLTHRNLGDYGNLKQCLNDTFTALVIAGYKDPSAMNMLDAVGRPGPGWLTGRNKMPGDYDECVAVGINVPGKLASRTIKGQYCNSRLSLNVTIAPAQFMSVPLDVWGVCLPDTCSSQDASFVVKTLLDHFNVSSYMGDVTVVSVDCHHPVELSVRAIAVLSLVGVIFLIVVIATTVDILLIQRPKWLRQSESERSYIQEDRNDDDDDMLDVQSNEELVTLLGPLSNIGDYIPGTAMRLLLSFSAWTNSQKIWDTHQPKSSLTCLNGIRVMSMSWVILGHCFFFSLGIADNAYPAILKYPQRWTFQAIYNATFSVDTFFVLSGCLVSYLTLLEMRRVSGRVNWGMFYLHRYIRLTPSYMLVLAIYVTTMPYWADGPFFPQNGIEDNFCEGTWWKNLLYIQNFFHNDKMCFGWSWYLADDMLFYVMSPLVLLPLYFKPLIGYLVTALLAAVSITTPFLLTMFRYYGPGVGPGIEGHKEEGSRTFDLYFAPYCRMVPYLEGLILGYVIYRCNRRCRINRGLNLFGWCVATATALAVIYGLFDYSKGDHTELHLAAFYNSLSRPAWGLCVCWVIFSCVVSRGGGLVNSFLSLPVWVPLSRLTYSVYLVHPIIILTWAYSRSTTFYMDDVSVTALFLAALVASYAIGFVVSIFFESPIMGLEKVIFKKEKRT